MQSATKFSVLFNIINGFGTILPQLVTYLRIHVQHTKIKALKRHNVYPSPSWVWLSTMDTLEFYLNVSTEFAEFSGKKFKKGRFQGWNPGLPV